MTLLLGENVALINCPECNREISEHAGTCPECGMKLHTVTAGLMKMTRKMESVRDEVQRDPEAFKARMEAKRAANNPDVSFNQGFWVVLLLLMLGGGGAWLYNEVISKPKAAKMAAVTVEEAKKSAEELRVERIKKGLDSWDGAPKRLKELIKKGMNDPDSYKHDAMHIDSDGGDYLVVTEKFFGKNAYGGVVRNWVKAKIDLDGNVLEVMKTSADE